MLATKLKVAAGVLAGALMSGGLAFAANSAEDGTIVACFTKQPGLLDPKGALRVVDSQTQCRSHEYALTWNQHGQPGPAGPQGAPGPEGATGPAGPEGAPGVTSYEIVSQDDFVLAGQTSAPVRAAFCPSGKRVIGGGSFVGDQQWAVNVDQPSPNGDAWWVSVNGPERNRDILVRTYAICATVQ